MPRASGLHLGDIQESIRRIELYTAGRSYEDFKNETLIQDGVCRNLAIIGEAVKKLPESLREQRPEIDWRKIAGLRDILVHEYAAVDLRIVWNIVSSKLPELRHAVEALKGGSRGRAD